MVGERKVKPHLVYIPYKLGHGTMQLSKLMPFDDYQKYLEGAQKIGAGDEPPGFRRCLQ